MTASDSMTGAGTGFADIFAVEPGSVRCPYGAYRAARRAEPVFWADRIQGFVVTRYDDIVDVLRAPERFSSANASGPGSVTGLAQRIVDDPASPPRLREHAERRLRISRSTVLLTSDPPLHVRQRKLVNKGFTARRVHGMEDGVRGVATGLVRAFVGDGEVEFVGQFASRLPMTVIADLLGVPASLHATFKRWSDAFTAGTGNLGLSGPEVTAMFASVDEFYDYFTEQVADRRSNPRDDLLSDLVAARIGGEEPLTLDEILQMLVQFLVAGNETTTNLLTTVVSTLAADQDLQATLRADPSRIPLLVEEVLRLESPVQGLFRRAEQDCVIGGVPVPAGSTLWLVYGSGNRDEAVFDAADELRLDGADARPHLAFGRGEHFCLGAGLARLETRVGVQILIEALHDIRLVGVPEDIAWLPNFVLHGIRELPLTFRAR